MSGELRVGLVLGGGGTVGLAYHAAALAALEHDLGWDPRTAQIVVGTSAGALVGALLRRGVPASDLAALAVGAPVRATPADIAAAAAERDPVPPFTLRQMLNLRPPPHHVVSAWARRPWRIDPVTAWAAFLADGRLDPAANIGRHAAALGEEWPAEELWLCAVRRSDLHRVTFGRELRPALSQAVLASCSVPGHFRPTVINGEAYLDGGVRSITNADVLRHEDLDLAIVVSPMSCRDVPRFGLSTAGRRYAKAKVDAEIERLRIAGIPSVLIEPGVEMTAVLGTDMLSYERIPQIVVTAFLDTGDQLRAPFVRTLLAGLRSRRQSPEPTSSVG